MRRDITDPPGITSEAESYDRLTCIQAIRGLGERIIIDKLEIGRWLVRLKRAVKHGDWLKELDELGIPDRSAQRWMENAITADTGEQVKSASMALLDAVSFGEATAAPQPTSDEKPAPQQGKLFQAQPQYPLVPPAKAGPIRCQSCAHRETLGRPLIKNCDDCRKARAQGKLDAPATSPGGQAPAGGDQPAADPPPAPGAPDVGDAAEALPPGTILDPEGDPLPPAAQELFAGAAELEAVVKELRSVVGHLRKLPAIPGGSFVPVQVTEKLLRAVWRMVWNHRLDKDNAYRCDGVGQHGCAGAGCSKCKGLGVVPKPLYGETPAKPKPRRPWGGRR